MTFGASLWSLARRGRNAQHSHLIPGYSSVAYPPRYRSVHPEAFRLKHFRYWRRRPSDGFLWLFLNGKATSRPSPRSKVVPKMLLETRSMTPPPSCPFTPPPLVLKNFPGASATRSTSLKNQQRRTEDRASGRVFQKRFTCFQQSMLREMPDRARSAQTSAERNRKNACRFAGCSLLRSSLTLLSLGNVVEELITKLSPFLPTI